METNQKKIFKHKKNAGFGLLDSLLALALFGTVLVFAQRETEHTQIYKSANQYQAQSLATARSYVGFLTSFNNNNLADVANNVYKDVTFLNQIESGLRTSNQKYKILSPTDTGINIPKNLYGETACVLLTYDNSLQQDEITGFMFYTSAKEGAKYLNKQKAGIIATSLNPAYEVFYQSGISSKLAGKTINDTLSFSGWHPTQDQIDYIKENKCAGNSIAEDSIIVNLGVIPQFNNRLVAISSVQNTADQSFSNFNSVGKYLPGHIYNNNTLKSNLSVNQKVVLQNTASGQEEVAMSVLDQNGANNKVLNVSKNDSDDNSTALLLSGVQATEVVNQGQLCNSNEIGKIAKSAQVSYAGKQLASNLVICTENRNLCSGTYCYLPFTPQQITFNATPGSAGLQGDDGIFMCPYSAPFAVTTSATSSSFLSVDTIFNQGGGATGGKINNVTELQLFGSPTTVTVSSSDSQLARTYKTDSSRMTVLSYNPYLNKMDMRDYVAGSPTQVQVSGGEPITYSDGTLTTPRGYRVTSQFSSGNCNSTCSAVGSGWGNILAIATPNILTNDGQANQINYTDSSPSLGMGGGPARCMCARMSSDNNYIIGLAVISNSFRGGLQSVTCSNVPIYNY